MNKHARMAQTAAARAARWRGHDELKDTRVSCRLPAGLVDRARAAFPAWKIASIVQIALERVVDLREIDTAGVVSRVRVHPPDTSPVDFSRRAGSLTISSLTTSETAEARALAVRILAAADELDELNSRAGS